MMERFAHGTDTVMLARRRDVLEIGDRTQARRVAEAMLEQLGSDAMREQLQATQGDIADDDLVQAIVEGLLGGHFVVLRHEDVPRPYDKPTERPISDFVDPEEPIPTEQRTTWFALRVVDHVGRPLRGVPVAFSYAGGQRDVSTDGDGYARLSDVAGSQAAAIVRPSAALESAIEGACAEPSTAKAIVAALEVVVAYYRSAAIGPHDLAARRSLTLSVQPFVALGRMVGMHFDTDRDFLLPMSLPAVTQLCTLSQRCQPCTLLVVGHTDTSGQIAHNEALSLRRAQVVAELVRDDVDGWLARYDAGVPKDQRWGSGEDRSMIGALPDAASRDAAEDPVRWFQRTRGLAEDGNAGPATRRALIGETMARDGTTIGADTEVLTHGCGEAFPLADNEHALDVAPLDGADDPIDRRVEIFFFGKSPGVQPPAPGPTSGAGTTAYPTWRARASELVQHVLGPHALEIVLQDEDGVPVAGARYVAVLPAGTVLEGALDDGGCARIERLPAGACRIDFPDLDAGFTTKSTARL